MFELYVAAIDFNFTALEDHAKWAVNAPPNKPTWICVGDINRAVRRKLYDFVSTKKYNVQLFVYRVSKRFGEAERYV